MGIDEKQREQDEQHLGLLTIFHYLYAVFLGFWGLFPLLYVFFGVVMIAAPNAFGPGAAGGGGGSGPPPVAFAAMMIVMGAAMTLLFLAMAIGTAICARCLSQRRGRIYCFVMSGIICTQMPIGTVLGVFTIIVLARDSVRALFEQAAAGDGPSDEAVALPSNDQ